jgi:hypothetical protein
MRFYESVTSDDIQRGNKRVREYEPDFVWVTRPDVIKLMETAERRVVRMPEKTWPNGLTSPAYDNHQILINGQWTDFGDTQLFDDVRHPRTDPPPYWDCCCGARLRWGTLYFVTEYSDH